ncbi:hypothetical protein [Pseudoalteromonas sp. ZZD1]|uniref:hypothetical protein n=1 Tax=Pseudoalteromonas sp. ZZD1 TaxID=3139395 RepID=UPI003BAC43D8
MSNLIHRIVKNAVLFTLLMSVSLTVFANDFDNVQEFSTPTTHYIACDIPDQANLDVDIDIHANELYFGALQPLPEATISHYVIPQLASLFNRTSVRGPPTFLI